MTILDCITRVDTIKPNAYPPEEKVRWLSYLDASIKAQIFDIHEEKVDETPDAEAEVPEEAVTEVEEESTKGNLPYSCDRLDDELLVPFPYDELYVTYLKAKIDEENGESARYNNTASSFNAQLSDFAKAYHREHMPKKKVTLTYV